MTRIDFYILADQHSLARQQFACRLTQRALVSGHQILLYLEDEQAAMEMDKLLWGWQPEAFIPHAPFYLDTQKDPHRMDAHLEPVMLGWGEQMGQHYDIVINLAQNVPPGFSRFERLLEIVVQEENVLEQTRRRYRFYKHRGFPITDNDLRL